MKFLWIGVNFNEQIKEKLLACGSAILSGAVSEANLLNGIDCCEQEIDTINSYQFPSFPRGPLFIERTEWSRARDSRDVSVGYFNLKYFNHISRKRSLKKEVRRWARGIPEDERVVVLVYSMHSPFLAAAKELKRVHKNTTISMLVLDLPQYMDMNMSPLKRLLKKIDWSSIKRYMKSVDKYVLYSRHMADFLGLREGSWMVMEGSYDASLMADEGIKQGGEKISVMYSGVLDLRYGIKELLDAFKELPKEYELWLTGNGNAVDLIKERAEGDSRIKYLGYLPTRLDLLNKQREATMLISTRDPSEPASTYCFPSKIFEYMVSGNPVLSTKINGIPDEYFNYIIPLDSIASSYLAEKIKEIATMSASERDELGGKAREFVLREKSSTVQMKKVIDFVKG